jgi:hypothetical protein
MPGPFHDVTDP